MASTKDHLHKAVTHHAKAVDHVREVAAKAAAEQEMRILNDRELTAAKLAGETKEG